MAIPREDLRDALRLIVITDRALAAPRTVEEMVEGALEGGARVIQLRDKEASSRELLDSARRLLALTRPAGALLVVNDRLDVALAAGADGVHVGPDDLPVKDVRRIAPRGFVVGASTDDPGRARALEASGADYLGCGAVFRTTTKDVGDEAIGPEGLDRVARAVEIPVVGIGGITAEGARAVAGTRAAGCAVVRAVMAAPDARAATRALLEAFEARSAERGG